MARKGQRTARTVREKAAEFFFEKGYDATTLREVAAASGVKVGSLYNHISSKEDLLHQVMGGIIDDLMVLLERALDTPGDTVDKLCAAIDCHVRFHATRAQESFIGNTNLRALSHDLRQVIIDKRNNYERILEQLIWQAGEEGLAQILDPRLHTYSIVALGTNVASWYKPGGRLELDEVVSIYTVLGLRQLGVTDPQQRVEKFLAGERISIPS